MKPTLAYFAFLLVVISVAPVVHAADHLEAPALIGNGDLDINDLYIFQSPTNSNNAVLAFTVNPFAGNISGTTFRSSDTASYQFQIDNTGDSVTDLTFTASFGAAVGGVQSVSLSRNQGGMTSVLGTGTTETDIATSNNGIFRAGLFDDPFFFDLQGFRNGFAFTGTDAFAGANVSAIVFELPSADLLSMSGGTNVGAIAVTTLDGIQFDRTGRPAVATALIASSRRDEFNQADVASDLIKFGDDVNAAIAGLSSQANADALTPILLPDLLTFDTSNSGGFLNGRRLGDDVIDATLSLVSAGAVTTDLVNSNDVAFRNVFPYLALAQVQAVPEPSTTVAMLIVGAGLVARRYRRRKS